MVSTSPASTQSLSPWYTYDIYINFAEPLNHDNMAWVDRVAADLRANLGGNVTGTPVRLIGRNDASPPETGASDGCAVMILFLTPEFQSGHPGWAELEAFHKAVTGGHRTPDQLIVCELQRYPDELRAKLPWAGVTGSQAVSSLALFSSLTLVAFTAEDKVQTNSWRLHSDVAQRLTRLRANHSAAAAALAEPKFTGLPDQAYLMEHQNSALWSQTRSDLVAHMNLVIYPEVLGANLSTAAGRRERRGARRRLLESCQALLLLRGDIRDDLIELSASAIADLKSVGEGVRPICIDWIGVPPPEWPPYFRPHTVVARQSWVEQVQTLLSAGDSGP